ncbi:MAG: universal stress protein [Phycisphaerales bacterium]|jgi:nucleotide-binding universal stress UspA family protein|nr:universal stress protein [Phycisphaerales bacterium]
MPEMNQGLAHVVVATDFSTCADAAVRHGARLAAKAGGRLTLLHVVTPILHNRSWLDKHVSAQVPTTTQLVAEAESRLRGIADFVGGAKTVVLQGHVLSELLRWCEAQRPDLIVLGAHSQIDAHRHLGYVASGAMRQAHAPVLAVHPDRSDRPRGVIRRVLVGTDLSETCRRGLRLGLLLAAGNGEEKGEVELLHVYGPGLGGSTGRAAPEVEAQLLRDVEAWARPVIEGGPKVDVTIAVGMALRHGEALLRHAETTGADVLVIGTQAHSSLRDVLFGSTAESVVRGARCAVLTVKPDGAKRGGV